MRLPTDYSYLGLSDEEVYEGMRQRGVSLEGMAEDLAYARAGVPIPEMRLALCWAKPVVDPVLVAQRWP